MRIAAVVAVLGLLAAPVWAQPFQGVYEGSYRGDMGESGDARAHVVALGQDKYKALAWYEEYGYEVGPLELQGEKKEDEIVFTYQYEPAAVVKDGRFLPAPGMDMDFDLKKVQKTSPTLGAAPPEGATLVLGPGMDALDAWKRWPEKWPLVDDGAMMVQGSSLITKESFGDCHIHLEFKTPFMPDARGQGRGNSGVYVMARYEVQILDSFGWERADNGCGGIYSVAAPAVNACLPPTEWQTYDIEFTAAEFDGQGNKTANARMTVRHNGELIHDDVEVPEPTPGGFPGEEATGPLLLQDHHNPVQFRNIWIARK